MDSKTYLEYFGYEKEQDILCEACHRPGHLHRIQEQEDGTDPIKNHMALCEKCEKMAVSGELTVGSLLYIHRCFLMGNRKRFVK